MGILTNLIAALTSACTVILNWAVTFFLDALNFSLRDIRNIFPMLKIIYSTFQYLSVGLTLIIAGWSLASFFLGSVENNLSRDRPVAILFRSFLASMLIYFGGYILDFFYRLSTIPYNSFVRFDVAKDMMDRYGNSFDVSSWGDTAIKAMETALAEGLTGTVGVAADLGLSLLALLLIIMIIINIYKLVLEVCQRFMVVAVLIYTAPLIYPCITTKQGTQIFKRWVGMLVSALILMTMSVAFFKLIIYGLFRAAFVEVNYIIVLLLVLAVCKIAQKIDSYMQQLGLSTATTGENLAAEMIATAAMFRRGGGSASKSGVLGANVNGSSGSLGSRTTIGSGYKAFIDAYANGKNMQESAGIAFNAMKYHVTHHTAWGGAAANAIKKGSDPNASTKDVVASGLAGYGSGLAAGVSNIVDPKLQAQHEGRLTMSEQTAAKEKNERKVKQEEREKQREKDRAEAVARQREQDEERIQRNEEIRAEKQLRSEQDVARNASRHANDFVRQFGNLGVTHSDLPEGEATRLTNDLVAGKQQSDRDAKEFYSKWGVGDKTGRVFGASIDDPKGSTPGITLNAYGSGLKTVDASTKNGYVRTSITGKDQQLGDFINKASGEINSKSIPDGIGQNARNDTSIPAEERMRGYNEDRASFLSQKTNIINNTVDDASQNAITRALNTGNTWRGDKESEDKLNRLMAPQGAAESDDSYFARIAEGQKWADKMHEEGISAGTMRMVNKEFGGLLGEKEEFASAEGYDTEQRTEHGNIIPSTRMMRLGIRNTETGDLRTVEIGAESAVRSQKNEIVNEFDGDYRARSGVTYLTKGDEGRSVVDNRVAGTDRYPAPRAEANIQPLGELRRFESNSSARFEEASPGRQEEPVRASAEEKGPNGTGWNIPDVIKDALDQSGGGTPKGGKNRRK